VVVVMNRGGLQGVDWGSPAALWLLLPVLWLPMQRFLTGSNRLAVARSGRSRPTARLLVAWVPGVFRTAALALLVIALARPQVTHREVVVESNGLDIMLAIDTSGSMRAEDFVVHGRATNRLEVAKGVIAEFVKAREYDRVGLVVFGEEAFTQIPLTLDHDTLVDVLETVEIGIAGSRGTAVGTAIAVSAKRLKQLEAPERVLILVTDGRSNAGRLSPMEAAEIARALRIRIYTIGVGAGGGGGLLRLSTEGVDEATLTAVAETTGGRFFRATDTTSLQSVYATIDELETSPAKVKELVEHEELYRRALIPSVVLLAMHLLLAATWLRRGP
jgi:Ca-activated chloride channel family protein